MNDSLANPKAQDAPYDFIVIGSGAGGGPLACNLAKKGYRVLVLEAGGWDEPEVCQIPAFHAHASEDPQLSWEFFVKHYSHAPQPDSKWDEDRNGIFYPRAGTVGGCTMHNAMITICGPNGDWDHIAELTGDASWKGDQMRGYFERLEHCDYVPRPGTGRRSIFGKVLDDVEEVLGIHQRPNGGRHGFDGWLHTTLADPRSGLTDPVLLGEILSAVAAAQGAGIDSFEQLVSDLLRGRLRDDFDPNNWQTMRDCPEGLVLAPIAVRDGQRNGPRQYLRQVSAELQNSGQGRLIIQTETLVSKILFEPGAKPGEAPTAIGVRYLRGKHLYRAHPVPSQAAGEEGEVYCRREVILCGGAYNTPQVLKLSGVGPGSELQDHGIPVQVDLPGVGANLQDRYEVGVISELTRDFTILRGLALGEPGPGHPNDPALDEWRAKKTGLYVGNAALLAILKKSRPDLPEADLCIFALPGSFRGYYKGYSRDIATNHNVLTWAILKAHTKNRGGTVQLRSSDPRDVPEINFHYFHEGTDQEGDDLAAMVAGVQFVREINRHGMFKHVVKQELWPGPKAQDAAAIRSFVTSEAWGHHASCTCPIGPDRDPLAVLDSRFRVRGVRGLRVVDASVFPRIPGIFIVSNVYMASEKASDVIAEDNPI